MKTTGVSVYSFCIVAVFSLFFTMISLPSALASSQDSRGNLEKFKKTFNAGKNPFGGSYEIVSDGKIAYKGKSYSIDKDTRIDVEEKYPRLIFLILNTKSMDDEERQYWFDIMPSMNDDQIGGLYDILADEERKLIQLNKEYNEEVEKINKKHFKEMEEALGGSGN